MTSPAPRRVGLLGGTFDPPHLGHLAAAEAVLTQLSLDEVVFVVANDPWQKSGDRAVTPADIRLEMAKALVEGLSNVSVDDREIRRGGPTYTVDTLTELHAEDPDAKFFLIVGADTARQIHTWHRHGEVTSLSTLVIVNRDATSTELTSSGGSRVEVVEMAPVDVSSTNIRRAVASGESIESMTTPAVARVIARHGLYRSVA